MAHSRGRRRRAAGDPWGSRFELVRYEQLAENATELEVDGLRVLVASLGDIIRSDGIADRAKDRGELEELRSLRYASGAG